ncbi:MAG: hypothetical protein U9Q34_08670, partial [Elusimicrobiota bacterium]|nr:hypothetical protein [Elusimicrobiota bacterium]
MFEKEGYDIVTKSKNHIINRASQLRNEAEDWLPVWFLRDYRYDSQNFITTEILLSNSSKSGRETKINQSFFLATKYKFKKRLKIDDWEYWSETSQDYYFYCKFSNKEN